MFIKKGRKTARNKLKNYKKENEKKKNLKQYAF